MNATSVFVCDAGFAALTRLTMGTVPEQLTAGMQETSRVLQSLNLEAVFEEAKRDMANRLDKEMPPPKVGSDGQVDGSDMESYLQGTRVFLESVLEAEAGAFSPGAWLWYLRNSPPELLSGGSKTKFLYVAAIAEAASTTGTTRRDPATASLSAVAYEINDSVVGRVARFTSISHLLLYIGQRIRLNRRGASWKMDGPWPVKELPEDLTSALERYDDRNGTAANQFFNRCGTLLALPFDGDVTKAPRETALSVLPVAEPGRYPLALGKSVFGDSIYSTHAVHAITLDQLQVLNQAIGEAWWRQSAADLLTLLLGLFSVVRDDHELLHQLQATGLWITSPDEFNSRLAPVHEVAGDVARRVLLGTETPSSPEKLLDAITTITGRLWPVEAHQVVRPEAKRIVLDLAAASRALDCAFEFSGHADTRERDIHFEKAIQWIVNSTDWMPEDALTAIPGKQLKIDGATVAEVDAIATKKGMLVVFDGRGTAYTQDFETGERNKVKSAMNQIEEKVTTMTTRLKILRATPKGDNYDFTGHKVLGAVVTAVPIYTSHPDSFAEEMDLPAVVSLGELHAWLRTH